MKKQFDFLTDDYYGIYFNDSFTDIILFKKNYCNKLICTMKDYLVDCVNKKMFAIITEKDYYEKLLSLGIEEYVQDENNQLVNGNLDVKFISLLINKYIDNNKKRIMYLIDEIHEEWSD